MSLVETPIVDADVRFSEATPSDFWALLKPRVMSLVVFTAFVGMMLAPGSIDPVLGVVSILAIAIGGGASGALNQWYDADIDALMKRTRNRPIPAGRVTGREALVYGLVLSLLSVMTLALYANPVAGALLAFTIFFYVVVYTMALKRSTPHNIVIGGAAGAFPSMIGWAAVTGTITVESVVLFLIVFLWTPAHFWALALFRSGDYGAAGVPMLPNVAGEAATKRQIVAYAALTALSGVAPALLGFASPVFGVVAALLGLAFVWKAFAVLRMPESDRDMKPAKALFGYSLAYLAMIFAGLLADSILPRLIAGFAS